MFPIFNFYYVNLKTLDLTATTCFQHRIPTKEEYLLPKFPKNKSLDGKSSFRSYIIFKNKVVFFSFYP